MHLMECRLVTSTIRALFTTGWNHAIDPRPTRCASAVRGEEMKSSEILDAIEECWGHRGRWIFLRELRVGTGHANSQAIDGFLMDCYPSAGMYRSAFEVKVSRSDFMRELRQPNKRREA